VRSNRAGVIRLLARHKTGSRARLVGQASKRLPKPGTATVTLKLDRAARKTLSEGKKLMLAIEARAPGARPRSMTIALRRTQS
jgi:hypothetical protein